MPDGEKDGERDGGGSEMSEQMIIGGLLSAFNSLVHAYEESKRIDAQMAALKADYKIKARALEIKRNALEMQHKENMEKISAEKENWLKCFELVRLKVHSSIENQRILREQTKDILNIALDPEVSQDAREIASSLYKEAWSRIMSAGDDAHTQLIQMIPQLSISADSLKQPDTEEE